MFRKRAPAATSEAGPGNGNRLPGQGAGGRRTFVLALVGLAFCAGCGHPQVAPANYRLIDSLRTALSARRSDWLEENASRIQKRHESGQMTDTEFAAFNRIIEQAKGGDWEGAEAQVIKLAKAQRPSGAPAEPQKPKPAQKA